ncbi:hypothetical protein [Shewanella nanhaiensis]|uniref:FAD-binding domain-containing protein n=1 Tax=Shewanella nanhaiensis TaxID=2864872 RepID=A0ABS7E2Z4_9GAMM|nr:hypothetical protein [Shewanella nanhaiensis]MBW8183526.1 hypothetical protein [Shewanella nanhaiensis]
MNIGIFGASINGLACALMLRQCGLNIEVFESSPSLIETDEVSLGALIWPQGVDVLRTILSHDQLLNVGNPINGMEVHNASGEHILQLSNENTESAQSALSFAFEHQGLLQLMANTLGDKQIHCGMSCTNITQINNKSIVHFDNGSTQAFDLVINADNLPSALDRLTSNETPSDTCMAMYSGVTCFDDGLLSDDTSQMFLCENARLLTHCINKVSKQRYWSVLYLHGNEALWQKSDLQERLQDLPEPVLAMIKNTQIKHTKRKVLTSQPRGTSWFSGLNLSLGMKLKGELSQFGFGITTALENAFTLSHQLLNCDKQTLPQVLTRYQERANTNLNILQAEMSEVVNIFYQGAEYSNYQEFKLKRPLGYQAVPLKSSA